MALQALTIKPGVNRDITNYAAEGGWWTTEKVRFHSGSPERIGGWQAYSPNTYTGVATSLFCWNAVSGIMYSGVGTNLKFYILYGQEYIDITPYRKTTSPLANNSITTVSGSNIITVTDAAHGALLGDYVHISGSAAVNNIPAAEINAEHVITVIVDADNYKVACTTNANASSAGGGAAIVVSYEVHIGLSLAVPGTGWGAGAWGRGTWGSAASTATTATQLRTWTQDTFGEDLVFCDYNGQIYYWDTSVGTGTRAVLLTSLGGASNTPTTVSSVLVTDDRHLVALGCNPEGSSVMDPMLVRWADTESLIAWTATAINTAGSQRLVYGNAIMASQPLKQETLIWTDTSLYSMQFIGAPLVFSFVPVGQNVSITGPYAYAIAESTAYWMGNRKFYKYDGVVQTLDCPLLSYIFKDFNFDQRYQVLCGTIERFHEVIWFYCSADTTSPDKYVIYNYREQIWYFGNMSRTAWHDSALIGAPLAAYSDSKLYQHETGLDDGTTSPASGVTAYIETADMDMADGDEFTFVRRMLPDVGFTGSTASAPAVTVEVQMRNAPGLDYQQTKDGTVTSAVATLDQFTDTVYMRLRGRQLAYKISSSGTGVFWQLGKPRLDMRLDGRK